MKRHEYREAMALNEVSENEVAIADRINFELMASLIHKMRGKRSLEKYAYDCGVSTNMLYNIITANRKRNLTCKQLNTFFQHREKNCGITMELLLSANGMLLKEDVAPAKRHCNQIVSDYKKYNVVEELKTPIPRSKKEKTPDFEAKGKKLEEVIPLIQQIIPEDIGYEEFLRDLSDYAFGKNYEYAEKLEKICEKAFLDKGFVKTLRARHLVSEYEWKEKMSAVRSFYLQNDELNLPDSYLNLFEDQIRKYIVAHF